MASFMPHLAHLTWSRTGRCTLHHERTTHWYASNATIFSQDEHGAELITIVFCFMQVQRQNLFLTFLWHPRLRRIDHRYVNCVWIQLARESRGMCNIVSLWLHRVGISYELHHISLLVSIISVLFAVLPCVHIQRTISHIKCCRTNDTAATVIATTRAPLARPNRHGGRSIATRWRWRTPLCDSCTPIRCLIPR